MTHMKDFATSLIVDAPVPSTSGTSIGIATGTGSRMPAVPFSAVVHPPTEMPTLDTAEKVQVTDITGDVVTIVRAQGDTTPKAIEAGWIISNTLFLEDIPDTLSDLTDIDSTNKANDKILQYNATTSKMEYRTLELAHSQLLGLNDNDSYRHITTTQINKLNGIEAGAQVNTVTPTNTVSLTNKTLSTGSVIDANVTVTEVLKKVYPVGSIYIATVSTNPATLLGFGIWSAYGAGRVIVGKAASGTFATAGATGGEETHTLTITEMPSHGHTISHIGVQTNAPGYGAWEANVGGSGASLYLASAATNSAGGGGAHNNLQPYIVAYMWERTE